MDFNAWLPFLGVMAAVSVAAGILSRGKTNRLDKLELLPGEVVLFDDTGASYGRLTRDQAVYNSISFMGATVRCTNRRLLVAQKGLFSKYFCVMFAIYYGGADVPDDQRSPFPFVSFAVSRASGEAPGAVSLIGDDRIRFHPLEQATYLPIYLELVSSRAKQYLALIQPSDDATTPKSR